MKKTNFMSMMLTVLAMLAVSVMSLSLTACSDDDDDKKGDDWGKFTQKVVIDGEELNIKSVEVTDWTEDAMPGYSIYLYVEGTDAPFYVYIPQEMLGKTLDLSKEQKVTKGEETEYLVIMGDAVDGENFKSGTARIEVNGNTVKIQAEGEWIMPAIPSIEPGVLAAPAKVKASEPVVVKFNVSYSGTATVEKGKYVEEEEEEEAQ